MINFNEIIGKIETDFNTLQTACFLKYIRDNIGLRHGFFLTKLLY